MSKQGYSSSPATPPPVTVLCGFLGAGKTTLLNHLLKQAEGQRWAAVVNDVAAINIDAAVVETEPGTSDVVPLGNGCVCCSNSGDLAETLARLAIEGKYDHLIVETTGVAEPRGIANLFLQKNPFGRCLGEVARLSSLVTVVDTPSFLRESRSQQQPDRKAPPSGERPVFELMVEQVECADLIILNKCDLASEAELTEVETVVRGLNTRAEILQAEHGQVPREAVLERVRFDPVETLGAPQWLRVLNAAADARERGQFVAKPASTLARAARHTERFGIRSFVFEARKPFRRAALFELFTKGIPGLLRAKGFIWVADQPDEMGFISIAGGVFRHDFLHYWWGSLVERGRVRRDQVPPKLEHLWQEPHGDRRQELVFIGVNLDEPAVRAALTGCLEA